MDKKIFFFDIDGTLSDGKSFVGGIPQSTIEAIEALRNNGHKVAIATGRPYESAKVFASDTRIDNVVCNGGYACYIQGKCITRKGMDLHDCHQVMHECLNKNIAFCVAYDETFNFYTHNCAFQKAIENDEWHALLHVEKDIDFFAKGEIYRMMIALQQGEETKITNYGSLVPSRYHKYYVIVEPDDKYEGVLRMSKELGVNESDIVVFGDGLNDVKMFERAPFCIAMGNGVQILKDKADYVTKRSDEDGIAYALHHFGWI